MLNSLSPAVSTYPVSLSLDESNVFFDNTKWRKVELFKKPIINQ